MASLKCHVVDATYFCNNVDDNAVRFFRYKINFKKYSSFSQKKKKKRFFQKLFYGIKQASKEVILWSKYNFFQLDHIFK
jgi:hypothetical protein